MKTYPYKIANTLDPLGKMPTVNGKEVFIVNHDTVISFWSPNSNEQPLFTIANPIIKLGDLIQISGFVFLENGTFIPATVNLCINW